jgi:hypothetical protein
MVKTGVQLLFFCFLLKTIFTKNPLIKQLLHGLNSNRTEFGLVIIERKGSCSSKHALLKQVADNTKD